MADLRKIKRRLGIEGLYQDDLLKDLIDDAESHFMGLSGADSVSDKYAYMIESVVYKLYSRKGSEAAKSESVDGYSVTYEDWDDLFKPYKDIICRDFGLDGVRRKRGKAWFF